MPTFTAHRLSSNNRLFPDRLDVNATHVIYNKGSIFGYQSTVIARSSIASAYYNGTGLFFADVIIESSGGRAIIASGFRKADAREIVNLLI